MPFYGYRTVLVCYLDYTLSGMIFKKLRLFIP
nr:MAG TPA: hypothetical protein [Caudoviricetes sp.]DAV07112.1 MAG TPA: hypothetical protein [Caudoviricetes sp.]